MGFSRGAGARNGDVRRSRQSPFRVRAPRGGTEALVPPNSLALDLDLDRLADQDPAALDGDVPGHAEVLAVDLGGQGEAHDLLAPRAVPDALQVEGQLDLPGDVLDREVTDDGEPVALAAGHPGRAEGELGELLHVQEVVADQVSLPVRVAGVEARGLDNRLRGGLERVVG